MAAYDLLGCGLSLIGLSSVVTRKGRKRIKEMKPKRVNAEESVTLGP